MATKRLSQIVAIEGQVKKRVNHATTVLLRAAQQNDLFEGFSRNYTPKVDGGDALPDESKLTQNNALELVGTFVSVWGEGLDAAASKDYANQTATADVVVDGIVLIKAAPVPYLLYLEKQLDDAHTFISALPVLPPSQTWFADPQVAGKFLAPATQGEKTKKIQKSLMLVPPTDKHPGQAVVITEDELVGTWTTQKYSTALKESVKKDLLVRTNALKQAVKEAREEANSILATTTEVSSAVRDYLLAGTK